MIVLDIAKLKPPLDAIRKNPTDMVAIEQLMGILKPVIKLTVDRFPKHLAEDIHQELHISIMRKAPALAEAVCSGKVENPTGYIFRLMYNEATMALNRELKFESRLVSIEDIKVEKIVEHSYGKRHKILDKIKEELDEWAEDRWKELKDVKRAKKYIDAIIDGKRPSFMTVNLRKFSTGTDDSNKAIYSDILQQLRKRLEYYWEEMTDDR